MGFPERSMWEAIRPAFAGLHAVRIESGAIAEGTPDVNLVSGWMELKYIDAWPVRPSTPVRVDHFRTEQRAWLKARYAAGGRTWVLLKIGENDWLLFDGFKAACRLGYLDTAETKALALARWTRKPKKLEIQKWLT